MISKNNNPFEGLRFLLSGLKLLTRPGLKRYLLVPLVINILVFVVVGFIGYTQFESLLDWMLPEAGWLSWLRYLLWPLFALATLLITFYTFTAVANLIGAPFNGILAARVEALLTGKEPPESPEHWAKEIAPAIQSELRKLAYFILRAVPLLILFIIPGLQIVAPFLWLAFGAWFLALEYLDYPMANHGHDFSWQRQQMAKQRFTALGFGGGVTLLMMIPILNFAAMPAAVIGATVLWCEQKQDMERTAST